MHKQTREKYKKRSLFTWKFRFRYDQLYVNLYTIQGLPFCIIHWFCVHKNGKIAFFPLSFTNMQQLQRSLLQDEKKNALSNIQRENIFYFTSHKTYLINGNAYSA